MVVPGTTYLSDGLETRMPPISFTRISHTQNERLKYVHTVTVQTLESYTDTVSTYHIAGKFWRGIKFGGLAVHAYKYQIKVRQYFLHAYIRMVIPYRTTKFNSANIFAQADSRQSAKFNFHQIFRLYGIHVEHTVYVLYRALVIHSSAF